MPRLFAACIQLHPVRNRFGFVTDLIVCKVQETREHELLRPFPIWHAHMN